MVGPDRSIIETNRHNKSFQLTACHTGLPDSTVASAKQQQEETAYACGGLLTQDGISVHVNPVGGLGGHVAPLAIGMVVGRSGLERLIRVEPRPPPPIAPQRVAGMRSLAVSHHDEPALEFVGVAYGPGGHLV